MLFCSGKDAEPISKNLNEDLEKVNIWFRENGLILNGSKTESMLFGTSSRLSAVTCFDVALNGFDITRVFEFKYLGVVLDKSLTVMQRPCQIYN